MASWNQDSIGGEIVASRPQGNRKLQGRNKIVRHQQLTWIVTGGGRKRMWQLRDFKSWKDSSVKFLINSTLLQKHLNIIVGEILLNFHKFINISKKFLKNLCKYFVKLNSCINHFTIWYHSAVTWLVTNCKVIYRVGRAIIKIPSSIKYKNYRNNTAHNTNKWIIPKHKERTATELSDQKLLSEELSRLGEIQERYDLMESAIKNIVATGGWRRKTKGKYRWQTEW